MSAEKYMKPSNANTNITPAVKLQVDKKPANRMPTNGTKVSVKPQGE